MNKIRIGILGDFQNGKSTFINCLLGNKVLQTGGDGVSVSFINTQCDYGSENLVTFTNCNKNITFNEFQNLTPLVYKKEWGNAIVKCNANVLRNVVIIDTPGFNANLQDSNTALEAIENIDFAIIVIKNKGSLKQIERDIIALLSNNDIPFMVVMNCLLDKGDSWNPQSNYNIQKSKDIENIISSIGSHCLRALNGDSVWRVNLAWYWYGSGNYLNDDPERQEELLADIEYYMKKHGTMTNKEFREQSSLDLIKSMLSLRLDSMMIKIKGMVLLHSALKRYSIKIKSLNYVK